MISPISIGDTSLTKARMHGGVLTWPAVKAADPDYIVLSSSLFDSAWMKHLVETQRLARCDPAAFNVRLYQDLLAAEDPGPTKMESVHLVTILRPIAVQPNSHPSLLDRMPIPVPIPPFAFGRWTSSQRN
jgi:hypothetical protein